MALGMGLVLSQLFRNEPQTLIFCAGCLLTVIGLIAAGSAGE